MAADITVQMERVVRDAEARLRERKVLLQDRAAAFLHRAAAGEGLGAPARDAVYLLPLRPAGEDGEGGGGARLARQRANGPTGQRSNAARAGWKSIPRGNGS